MTIIGLLGLAGSGKNTVGQYIQDEYGFAPVSFADGIKDCLSCIFGWDRQLLEGKSEESRIWREEIDKWWAERLGIPHFTPRFAMTHFGSDVMRNYFHDNIWVLNIERKIQTISKPIVITDVRFAIEMQLTTKLGGKLFRVKRGPDPIWTPVAVAAIGGDKSARERMEKVFRVHESEWASINQPVDAEIRNDADLDALYANVEHAIRRARPLTPKQSRI